MDIGKRVRELREAHGLTITDLAERSDLTRNAVSRIELGRRTPGSATVEKLAQGLGVEPGALYSEQEPGALFETTLPKPPPQTMTELLDVAGVEGREIERPIDKNSLGHIDELFEDLPFEGTIALARRIINARHAVKTVIDRYLEDPDTTPKEASTLTLFGLHAMQAKFIAILRADEAAQAEVQVSKDIAHAEAVEREHNNLVVQGR